MVKNPPADAGDIRDPARFHPWVGKIPWKRGWQPIPASSLGEPHGQRSLMGYCPRGHKESGTTEVTEHTHSIICVHQKVGDPEGCTA